MATYENIDELVHSVSLFIPNPLIYHGYVLPFVILYAAWIYEWVFVYGVTEYYEAGLIGISVIGLGQILCCLCCYWSVHVQCFFTCSRVKNPFDAKVAKVVPTPNNGSSELVKVHCGKREDETRHLWFFFQKTKYIWDDNKKTFREIEFPINHTFSEYMEWKGYQEDSDVQAAEMQYGKNELVMVVPEFLELFKERATAPFFVFQLFCVALWCLDRYWYYSLLTLTMLIIFEFIFVHQQLKNMAEIRNMGNKPYMIQVFRNRRWRPIFSSFLVPGDIVSVVRSQNENLIPCDMLLLRGSCIVDESMLTGESVPQMKEPIEYLNSDTNLNFETDGKLHVLFGGTKVVQQTAPNKLSGGLKAHDNGCIAYVLRTSFNTSQGKLLRTILFGVKRVTANNRETFAFILFLLIFAITAAAYVWIKGCENPNKNTYKLMLECAFILTAVVPPELPIELSLAVNASVVSLSKLDVFCTEPFRIPFAGKIDVCCFDKTGTLTSDNFVVEGVAGLPGSDQKVTPITESPPESIQILASCHSLVQLDDGIVGDPLEKAALTAVGWTLTKTDSVIPKKGKIPGVKIYRRYYFSSELKRMSVVAGYVSPGSSEINFFAAVKGAPETMKEMFLEVPPDYDETYLEMSRKGARVLALGWKELDQVTPSVLRGLMRNELECGLKFAGFVVISSPLKADSKSVIKEILNASHAVVMITGDNPLTACHVARELKFTKKPITLLFKNKGENHWVWESIDQKVQVPFDPKFSEETITVHDLCITGEGLTFLMKEYKDYFYKILPYVAVFARVAPKQKELVIIGYKSLGFFTVMCGDGTNDVGALKQADVGVAILSNAPERRRERERVRVNVPSHRSHDRGPMSTSEKLQKMLKDMEEQERPPIVKLGDASIAAPFSSKLSSIQCICHVIKQGRCTLVTTLQMFKILALNALILAYSQSVLYIDGIKYSDTQVTFQGVLLAFYFLFVTWSRPLKTLSRQRPLPNIFNLYTISTVFLQFIVHFGCLVYLLNEGTRRTPLEDPAAAAMKASDLLVGSENDTKSAMLSSSEEQENEVFVPTLLGSSIYIISMGFQVTTFAVNYRGHPFMESLWANRALIFTILLAGGSILSLALGIFPSLAAMLEIVELSSEFRWFLVQLMVADFAVSLLLDRTCLWLLGEGKVKLKR